MGERKFQTEQLGTTWSAACDGITGWGATEWEAIERAARRLDRRTRKLVKGSGQGHMPHVGLVESTYEALFDKIDDYYERALKPEGDQPRPTPRPPPKKP